ncbi:MAG TPA: PrsW family intramembrane metalloprotease [Myxococcales bacterium]|nr:PrsW family intramembrane metalloprotease [Myxococcales bacterium]HIN85633.1 PrsW family intramembrane metalloprotease [Myxococcales bacterium]
MSLALFAIAIAPGLAIATYFYFRDKYDREPFKPLFVSFLLGAFMVIPAALLEGILIGNAMEGNQSLLMSAVIAFVFVALVEEGLKYGVLKGYAFKHPAFNEPFDGIVYSVMVSMGFATLENVFYVYGHGWGVGFLRMFTAVPMHAAVGVLMGYYVGKAKFSSAAPQIALKGLALATLFHGAYDFWLFQKWNQSLALLAFVVLAISLRLAKKSVREQVEDSPFKPHS